MTHHDSNHDSSIPQARAFLDAYHHLTPHQQIQMLMTLFLMNPEFRDNEVLALIRDQINQYLGEVQS